jgi:hypothetical protein
MKIQPSAKRLFLKIIFLEKEISTGMFSFYMQQITRKTRRWQSVFMIPSKSTVINGVNNKKNKNPSPWFWLKMDRKLVGQAFKINSLRNGGFNFL